MFSQGVQKIKLSKSFHDICVNIGECKSREAEEQIVGQWMQDVKKTLSKSKIGLSDLYENVISLVHLTLLGYDTSFGQIQAVNLTQDSQMMTKALGYLACSALFDSKSDLIVLIVNSTQRDLSSGHPTSMALALTAIAQLVTPELIQPVIGFVGQCLNHTVPIIRQKAVMCVHSFIEKDPTCVVDFFPDLCRLLSDTDLSIVNAVVTTFTTLLDNKLNIRQICELVPDLVRTAQQILTSNTKIEFVHQKVNAPFILVNIYRLMQKIAANSEGISEQIEPLITQSLQTGTLESPASASILYEAIRTAICLELTEIPQLKGAISLFMSSREQNYKYIGLSLLSSIPDFATEFQGIIIDCLEHPDPSIRLITLNLLHAMASPDNSQIIVVNMLKFLQKTKNETIRRDLSDRITDIASKYSPSPIWFAKTMEQLFSIGGDLVRPEVAFQVMKIIDDECDEEMRRSIVNLYLDVAQSARRLSDVFVTVIAHVIGNYAELSDEYDLSFIILLLCDLADGYDNPREWVLNAILKLLPKIEEVPQEVLDVFENYKQSRSIIVQNICYEALQLLNFRESLNIILTMNVEEDPTLSFLDDFVNDAIAKGGKQYIPIDDRDTDVIVSNKPTLIYTAYPQNTSVYSSEGVSGSGPVAAPPEEDNTSLNTAGVAAVWGQDGLVTEQPEEEARPAVLPDGMYAADSSSSSSPSKKPSMFAKLSIAGKKAQNNQDEKKEKLAASIFKGVKPIAKKPKQVQQQQQQQQVEQPVSQPAELTPEQLQMIETATQELQTPPPQQIAEFSQSGISPQPVYSDETIKVISCASNGKILLAAMNATSNPIVDFKLSIDGPEVLNKDVVSQPQTINCIPPQNAVTMLATYSFPKTMKGFPQFKFAANIEYNGKKINVPLPANLLTFIAPQQSTTAEFGAAWKSGGSEIVYTIPRSEGLTIDEVSRLMNLAIGVKTVQRIGQEEIFMGILVSTPFKILIHVKFGNQKVDFKVLTKAQPLTASIVNDLKTVFA
ncbi:Adaptin N terminal region family protein [Trichomonas vaginalis G3]|uniref:AP-2 complex subunit alpha n=1 Tax=Trichomonas vaginalis (strain ATCC PRA-98 / G3) TaxID=412133 RepID=A2EQ12_TRIV3|nr:adaptin, alpha/gamma/epsilon family [Trichomonas vaginalis G3]EAY05277.1 Adaptin N terminal region family protein [Trichomonas vaginalis G3]KAI5530484.1 adaptin, alpha/gamma/epsilon family [Trichomonas vaginalis G3]|eukprot:XP_001317500.1 Adaptin N terminal region family protein [Trichomonas vaginalis G3]